MVHAELYLLTLYQSFIVKCKTLVLHQWQQVPGITDLGLMPRKVAKVAIVGGGLMGSGIATALILSHYPVILKEVNEKFLNAGIDRIKGRTCVNLIYIIVTFYLKFVAS